MAERHDLTDGFLNPAEFAAALGVSTATVQAWIRSGELPAVRLGRIALVPRDALRRLLEGRRPGP